MILTFYSFKGGVGRSHSLLEVAFELAMLDKSVLVLDLDLEAPGLQKHPDLVHLESQLKFGTLDLLLEFQKEYDWPESLIPKTIVSYQNPVTESKLKPLSLDFLFPSRFQDDDDYAGKFAQVKWDELFEPKTGAGPAFFHRLTRELSQQYDYILIDSRTGFTDLGAICTIQLPDQVVIVFSLNQQNIHGIQQVYKAITQDPKRSRYDDAVPVILLPNLVPDASQDAVLSQLIEQKCQLLNEAGLKIRKRDCILLKPRLFLSDELWALRRLENETPYQRVIDDILSRKAEIESLQEQEKKSKQQHNYRPEDPRNPDYLRRKGIYEKAKSFEQKVADLFEYRGFKAIVYYKQDDYLFDIRLEKADDLFPEYALVECKDTQAPVSRQMVLEFQQKIEHIRRADNKPYRAIMVARTGFVNNTHVIAETHGIQLRTYQELLLSLVNLQAPLDRALRDYRGTILEMMYVEQDVRFERQGQREIGETQALSQGIQDWLDRPNAPFLALLGDFGTGKTAFCKKLACELALQIKENPAQGRRPLLLHLKDLASTTFTLENILTHYFQSLAGQTIQPQALLHLNREGHLLLIFDGFDEIIGYAEPSLFVEILRQILRAAEGKAKVLLTCRTHYFKDYPDENQKLANPTSLLSSANSTRLYDELRERPGFELAYLQTFNSQQIETYLKKALPPPANWREFHQKIKDTYHLENLAERPFLLEMIVKSLPHLLKKATQSPITVADLYESYCEDWFNHTGYRLSLTREHKVPLIAYLARLLWDSPENRVHYEVLYEKALEFFEDKSLHIYDREKMDYEIRTALFLNRDPAGYYSFIHRSFLEFFMARLVRDAMLKHDHSVLNLHNRLSKEIVFFLEAFPEAHLIPEFVNPVLQSLHADPRSKVTALLLLYYHCQAQLGPLIGPDAHWQKQIDWPLQAKERFQALRPAKLILDHIDLSSADLQGIDLSGASLKQANFQAANLNQANLAAAQCVQADFSFARLIQADLSQADLSQTDLNHVQARETNLQQANLTSADLTFGSFVRADFRKAILKDNAYKYAGFLGAKFSKQPEWITSPWVGGVKAKALENLTALRKTGVTTFSWSPDGNILASGSILETIILWDIATGVSLKTLNGNQEGAKSIDWLPDGEILASTHSESKDIILWNMQTGKEINKLEGHQDWVNTITWSPDGQLLASGSYDETIILWSLQTNRIVQILEGHHGVINTISWSPNGKMLASGCRDKTIILWNTQTGKEIKKLEGHQDWVNTITWSPDGKELASGSSDKTIILWNVQTGKEIKKLEGHQDWVNTITWSPDGQILASGGDDRMIVLWDAHSGKEIKKLDDHSHWINTITWSPDGKTLISGGDDSENIILWNLQTGKPLEFFQKNQNWPSTISWSPNGKILASGSSDKTIILWNTQTGKEIKKLEGHQDWVNTITWSPDGKELASGSSDKTIILWNVQTGKEIKKLEGHRHWISSIAWAPDRENLASGSRDKTIILWDKKTGKASDYLEGHRSGINSIAWSPDSRILASGSDDGFIILWDTLTSNEWKRLSGNQSGVKSIAWSPDGNLLASGGYNKTVNLWDVKTGKLLQTLKSHQSWIKSIAWSSDGKKIASCGSDQTIILWDISTFNVIKTLHSNQGGIQSISWSPDTQVLASAGHYIQLWNFHTEQSISLLSFPEGEVIITSDDYVDGNPEALQHVRFGDGWATYDLDAMPERHSPQLVQAAFKALWQTE